MTQADSVHTTPRTNSPIESPADSAGTISAGLALQQRARERALKRLARLRKKALDEIERLLIFLDASDPYASTELEQNGDEDEDGDPGEDGAGDEPSLGSHEIRPGGAVSYRHHPVSDGCDMAPTANWTRRTANPR